MSASQNLEFLTPGSVWVRPKDGRTAKFLFLTNKVLPAAVLEKHPPQVIYSDETGNIYNRDVDDFFRIYSFLNVDGELEKRLESLLRFDAAALATLKDEDEPEETPVAEPEQPQVAAPVVAKPRVEVKARADVVKAPKTLADDLYTELTGKSRSPMRVRFAISSKEGFNDPALSAQDLENNIVVYSAQPDEKYDMTVHKLVFKLTEKVTFETLREVFHPSNEVNTVDAFQVATRYGVDETVWDSWIGVFPEFSVNGLYAVVHIGSSDSPIDTEDTPGIDAVSVKHTHDEGISHESTQVPDISDIHSLVMPPLAATSETAIAEPAVEIMEAAPAPVEAVLTVTDSAPVVVEPVVQPITQPVVQPVVQPVQAAALIEAISTPTPVVEAVPVPVAPVVQPVVNAQVVSPQVGAVQQ